MQFNSETQLKLLYQTGVRFSENNYQRFKMQDVITLMKKLPSPHKSMAQEFLILMKLVLSLSVTNAFSKRRFSALKKIKHEAEGCGSFFLQDFLYFYGISQVIILRFHCHEKLAMANFVWKGPCRTINHLANIYSLNSLIETLEKGIKYL